MKIKERINLNQALVRYGNGQKYFSVTIRDETIKAIYYYPALHQVAVVKATGKVNYYQRFNGLFSEELLEERCD